MKIIETALMALAIISIFILVPVLLVIGVKKTFDTRTTQEILTDRYNNCIKWTPATEVKACENYLNLKQ